MSSQETLAITLTINGEEKTLTVHRSETLLDALRRASYASVKHGCKTGDCGACTVLLDGEPVRSCMLPAVKAEGRQVTTVEALAQGGQLHPIQEAFIETGAIQCGYCTPAQILVIKAAQRGLIRYEPEDIPVLVASLSDELDVCAPPTVVVYPAVAVTPPPIHAPVVGETGLLSPSR